VPRWTPTAIAASTIEPPNLPPCVTVTPEHYTDQFCEIAP
jgi:hypothetical protein